MEMLGETLEKIAWQKGGICKPGCPAFTSPQFPSPMRVLAERAKELGVRALRIVTACHLSTMPNDQPIN